MKQEEKEMELLLDEIPRATSPHPHHQHYHHHGMYLDDPSSIRGYHRPKQGSSSASSSLPGNISPDGDDSFRRSPELGGGLLERFRALHVRDEAAAMRRPAVSNPNNQFVLPDKEYGSLRGSVLPSSSLFDDGRRLHCGVSSNLFDASSHARPPDALMPYPNGAGGLSFLYGEEMLVGRNSYCGGIREQELLDSVNKYLIAEAYLSNIGNRGSDFLNAGISYHRSSPELHNRISAMNGLAGTLPNSLTPHSVSMSRNPRKIENFDCENGLVVGGNKGVCQVGSNGHEAERERMWWKLNSQSHAGETHLNYDDLHCPKSQCSCVTQPKHDVLMDAEGSVYYMAKDQNGCRLLQKNFDEGKPQEVDKIFNGIIDHVIELMVNPFGNYLVQKLLDACSEEQRTKIVVGLTKDPTELVKISLNCHGTRAVQKLIDTLKTQQQISLVVSALQPAILDLIKDLNGNHVVQRCLQSLSTEENKFIFDAAVKHCVDIATQRHGCCVLQRCLGHSSTDYRAKLVAEICANGLLLAQDAFGNYVVQYILDLGIVSATASLVSQFEGNYVHLSRQKFSSNVVEKCLKVLSEDVQAKIIIELLAISQFEQLLHDPYANYVIQSAFMCTKGPLHAVLLEAIRPHVPALRTSPYCKRIYSQVCKRSDVYSGR